MPRIARVVLPGIPLHITQRGIRRLNVFGNDSDRHLYIDLLQESCRRFHLRICAYCLMTNHVHFVAIPEYKDSVWRTFHRCHGTYAKHFNMRYAFTGHLWQARPFSCALDEEHFWGSYPVCGAQSSPGAYGGLCGRLPLVQCGGSLRLASGYVARSRMDFTKRDS